MRIEFEKLEQRPGSHVVPVKMTREELEAVAEKMADVNVRIAAKEDNLRSYQKEIREEIKRLEEERNGITRTYRFKREPKPVDGMWGFDFEDNGRVKCKTCVERYEKNADAFDGEGVPSYETAEALMAAHDAEETRAEDGRDGDPEVIYPNQIGAKHPTLAVWQRPLGTKWFVDVKSGDVYGPIAVVEKDLQKNIPQTKEIKPVVIAFDSETAVPLLNEDEVSIAEKKLKETETEITRENDDTVLSCNDCGLPLADHPPSLDDDPQNGSADPCKAAMLIHADRANAEQAKRTEEKYGNDEVLDPDTIYSCGKCSVDTFGRDLQPVTIDGEKKFVCFSCEQGIPKGEPAPEQPKKKKGSRKKKEGGAADAQA